MARAWAVPGGLDGRVWDVGTFPLTVHVVSSHCGLAITKMAVVSVLDVIAGSAGFGFAKSHVPGSATHIRKNEEAILASWGGCVKARAIPRP